MKPHSHLGEFELLVLLTVVRLQDEAYGVTLARELGELRRGNVSLATVYTTLDRLEVRGLVSSRLGEPTPERGGRAKRYFHVTAEGLRVLNETRTLLERLWTGLPSGGEGTA